MEVLLETLKHEDATKRVDVNLVSKVMENSALHYACKNGNSNIVKLLLETLKCDDVNKRIRFDSKNADSQTPMDIAKGLGHEDIVSMLENSQHHDKSFIECCNIFSYMNQLCCLLPFNSNLS